jgi:mono/diheme cytochrome c family protein
MARLARTIVVVLALVAAPAHADDALIAAGRVIAAKNCSHCHAIGPNDLSPNPKSPPFRTLAQKYPLSNLEEALGEGIMVGHEGLEMPNFRFDAQQIAALMAFLESIQKK